MSSKSSNQESSVVDYSVALLGSVSAEDNPATLGEIRNRLDRFMLGMQAEGLLKHHVLQMVSRPRPRDGYWSNYVKTEEERSSSLSEAGSAIKSEDLFHSGT